MQTPCPAARRAHCDKEHSKGTKLVSDRHEGRIARLHFVYHVKLSVEDEDLHQLCVGQNFTQPWLPRPPHPHHIDEEDVFQHIYPAPVALAALKVMFRSSEMHFHLLLDVEAFPSCNDSGSSNEPDRLLTQHC